MLLDELLVNASELALDYDTTFTLTPNAELASGPLGPKVAEHLRLELEAKGLRCYSARDEPTSSNRMYIRVYIETGQIMCHSLAEVMAEKEDIDLAYWEKRGKDDAKADKPPLFRLRKGKYVAVSEESFQLDWTNSEEHAIGETYIRGYDSE